MKCKPLTRVLAILLVVSMATLQPQKSNAVWIQVCLAAVVVVVAGTAYVVVKKSTECIDNPRCDVCNRRLPDGVWICPTCETDNTPQAWEGGVWTDPTSLVIQWSHNGYQWQDMHSMPWDPMMAAQIEVTTAKDINAYMASITNPSDPEYMQPEIISTNALPGHQTGYFRITSQ